MSPQPSPSKARRPWFAFLILALSLLSFASSSWAAIPADNWTVRALAGANWHEGSDDGTGAGARFSGLHGFVIDATGTLYAADTLNHRIRKITAAGAVSTLAGSVVGSVNGTGTNAKFSYPQFLALDAANNLYVSETVYDDTYSVATHQIRKVTSAGVVTKLPVTLPGRVTSIATYGSNKSKLAVCIDGTVYSTSTSLAATTSPAEMLPLIVAGEGVYGTCLSSSASGALYIAQDNGAGVYLLPATGTALTVQDFSNALMPSASLSSFAVDASGAYYFAFSSGNNAAGIFRVNPTRTVGGWVVGGQDMVDNWWSYSSTGPGADVTIFDPIYGMAVSPKGILTFAESGYVPFDYPESFYYGNIYGGPCTVRSVLPFSVTGTPEAQTLSSTQTPTSMSVAVTAGSVTYQWYKAGLPISGATQSSYKPLVSGKTVPGIYNVEVVVGSGSDRGSYFSEPIPVRVTNAVVEEVRASIVNATPATVNTVLNTAKTKTATLAATNGEAAFINAAATVALLWSDSATTALATKLGFDGSLNPLEFTAFWTEIIPAGLLSTDGKNWLVNKVYPALKTAETQLALIKDTSFFMPMLDMPSTAATRELSAEVRFDYADIQLMRAGINALIYAIKFAESMNTDFEWDSILKDFSRGRLSLEWILSSYPNLLKASSTGAAAATASVAAAKAGVTAYLAWSDFVLGKTATANKRINPADSGYLTVIDEDDVMSWVENRASVALVGDSLSATSDAAAIKTFGKGTTVRVSPKAFVNHAAGWRTEASALVFEKNLLKAGGLTSSTSAAVKTIKSVVPDLTADQLLSLETQMIDLEPYLNLHFHTREDILAPTPTINTPTPMSGSTKLDGGSGYIVLSGTVTDMSEVTSLIITQSATGFASNVVEAILTETDASTEKARIYTWTAEVPVYSGTNTFSVVATDKWGSETETPKTLTAVVAVSYAFDFEKDGLGTVTGVPTTETVEGGSSVTLTATPATNWVFRRFEYWIAGEEQIPITTSTLTAKIQSDTRVVAVFEKNPFRLIPASGVTLSRLFENIEYSDDVDTQFPISAVTVTVGKSGILSGRLKCGRELLAFNGTFNANGTCEVTFPTWNGLLKSTDDPKSTAKTSVSVSRQLTFQIDEGDEQPILSVVPKFVQRNFSDVSEPLPSLTMGKLAPATVLSKSARFNLGSGDTVSKPQYISASVSLAGSVIATGVVGNGERFTLSGRLQDSFYTDDGSTYSSAVASAMAASATLVGATSNKYTTLATNLHFAETANLEIFVPSADTSDYLMAAQYKGEWWTANNREKVTIDYATGFSSYDPGSSWAPEYVPPQSGELTPFGSAGTRASFVVSDQLLTAGILQWNGSRLLVDSTEMSNIAGDTPSMVSSGTGLLKFTFNSLSGTFTGSLAWKEYNENTDAYDKTAVKTFTGVILQNQNNGGDSSTLGIGMTKDGTPIWLKSY